MSGTASRFGVQVTLVGLLVVLAETASGAVSITGHARYERIKGKPAMGYVELYESKLGLSPPNSSFVGPSSHLGGSAYYTGTSCTSGTTWDGMYCFENVPAGLYSLIINEPLFFIAPTTRLPFK